MDIKIIVWILINCLLPLLPPGLTLVGIWLINQSSKRLSWQDHLIQILGDGQLFFYCTSLSSATISDLLSNLSTLKGDIYQQCVLSIVILVLLILIITTFYGSVIIIRLENPNNQDATIKTTISSILASIFVTVFVLFARNQGGLFK